MGPEPLRARFRLPEALVLVALSACGEAATPTSEAPGRMPIFTDVTAASGLDFVHSNGMSGELYFVENMGQGAGLFDFDRDGDLDAYLVQGAPLPANRPLAEILSETPATLPLVDRLYRNDGPDAAGIPRFVDVTAISGIVDGDYGMGVATGDVDNDGWVDLYVTNFGPNHLFRNRGDGTFDDVTTAAGVSDARWNTCATFFDYDRDGWLDLFVCAYLDFQVERHTPCRAPNGLPDYCSPANYEPMPNRLFRNRGDGSFEDVSRRSGIDSLFGGALGVVAADFDGDGWADLYVGNDQRPNQLWINQKDGTFRDTAPLAGCSVNREGRPEATMGVDAADFDDDGDLDLFMVNLTGETNTLYVNQGEGVFRDRTAESGLGPPSFAMTGFGTGWLDFDNDSRLDLLVANGAVRILPEQAAAGVLLPLRQRNQLFRNLGNGRFEEVGVEAGPVFELSEVSRGAAFGDLDDDGDLDVLLVNNHGRARLLLAATDPAHHWLGLRLVEVRPARDMLGARAAVTLADGRVLTRRCHTDGSYLAASDPRLHVGLGDAREVREVEVTWPDGSRESWTGLAADRYHELRRGEGRPRESPQP